MTGTDNNSTDETNEGKSERVEAAENAGSEHNDITTAVQDAVESSSGEIEAAVEKAEDAAEEVVETILEASEEAAEKIGDPELADRIAELLFARFQEAGLTVGRVAEEAIEAAEDTADTAVSGVADISDSIAPRPEHPWYGPPSEFFKAVRRKKG